MTRRRLVAVARKEWLHILRDPRSLGVALALPVLLLLLVGAGMNFDLRELPFCACDLDGSRTSRELVEEISQLDLFRLQEMVASPAEGEELLRRGEARFALVLPPGLERDLLSGRRVAVQVLLDGADSNAATVARGYLNGFLARWGLQRLQAQAERAGPAPSRTGPAITVSPRIMYNPALQSQQFIVPGLIVVVLIILGTLLTSGALVRERERGSFESLAASPVRAGEIILGKALPYLAVGILDTAVAMAVGALVFGVRMEGNPAEFLAFGALFLLCAMALGLFFSTVAQTQQLALMISIISTLLPTIMLSGFVFPVRNMPVVLQWFSKVVPATHFLTIARGMYFKGVGPEVFWPSLVAIVVIGAVIGGVTLRRFRKQL